MKTFILLLSILPNIAFGQWTLSNFTPSFGSASQVEFPSPNAAYVLANGEIHKSTDGGMNWTMIYDEGPFSNMSNLLFLDENVGFVKSWSNNLKTIDGGATWTSMNWFYDIEKVNGMLFSSHLSNDTSYISTSMDQGDSWSISFENYKPNNGIFHISFISQNEAFFIEHMENNNLLHTSDNFATIDTFAIVPNGVNPQSKFEFIDAEHGYFFGNIDMTTSSPTRTWFNTNGVVVFYTMDLDGFGILPIMDLSTNTSKFYACSHYGKIFSSQNWGETGYWTEMNTPIETPIYSISFCNNDQGIAVAGDKILYVNNASVLEINQLEKNKSIIISPNPAYTSISIENINSSVNSLSISDMNGKIIIKEIMLSSKKVVVDISTFSPGIYFLKSNDSGSFEPVRFIKK